MIERAYLALQKYFGYREFRKSQKNIIESILEGKDVLTIMPTGGGKSICYQIPALLFEGITIVISPLISLMKDQVDNIKEAGINAAYINSSLSYKEILAILDNLKSEQYKLLYVAPERLESKEFCELIKDLNISQVAVDEAHCVSQWGHDFRSSYRYISKFISELKTRPVLTAFTATATEEVREDIVKLLQLNNPKVYISGFDRENLKLNVSKCGNKLEFILRYLNENKDSSGIIYAATRKDVDNVYELLLSKGYLVSRYHAGLSEKERYENQENFVYDKVNIMVATNAFGMGIDKSNVRYVIHYNMPKNIESYYQEIGRAGRDGEESECILLFSPSDVQTQKYLIEISVEDVLRKQSEYKKLQNMVDYVHYNRCYREYILNYFGETYDKECGKCSNCNNLSETVDKTEDAQKVLSCIYRMRRSFGINMIVDVLRGSSNKKLLSLGFDEISTYGIMKNYSKEGLRDFINTLISHSYMDLSEGEYSVVKLNEKSYSVLKGQEKVLLKEMKKINKVFDNNLLYEELRMLRRRLAEEEKIPPYLIFSDSTLKEMSTRYPGNKEEILDISGVGEVKYEKYGEKFIEVIKEYVDKNDIEAKYEFKAKYNAEIKNNEVKVNEDREKPHKTPSNHITIEFLKQNGSIIQTAKERELSLNTIFSHILNYAKEGNKLDFYINYDELFDKDAEEKIMEVAKEVGYDRLKPIKEKLPSNINYNQIWGVIIKNYF